MLRGKNRITVLESPTIFFLPLNAVTSSECVRGINLGVRECDCV